MKLKRSFSQLTQSYVSINCGSEWGSEGACKPCFSMRKGIADPPATAGGMIFGLWLFVTPGKMATVVLGAVGIDCVAFDHPVERASIDAEYLGGACAITAGHLEDV